MKNDLSRPWRDRETVASIINLIETVLLVSGGKLAKVLDVSSGGLSNWRSGRQGMAPEKWSRLLAYLKGTWGLEPGDILAHDSVDRFKKAAERGQVGRVAFMKGIPPRGDLGNSETREPASVISSENDPDETPPHPAKLGKVKMTHVIPTGSNEAPYLKVEPTEPIDLDSLPDDEVNITPDQLQHVYGTPVPLPPIHNRKLMAFLLDPSITRAIGLQWIEVGMLARTPLAEWQTSTRILIDLVMQFREARERGEIIDAQLREEWEIDNKRSSI